MEDRGCKHHKLGRIFGGLIIIGVGVLFLLRVMGTFFPSWLFTWPSLLIVIGMYVGARRGFRPGGWLVMMLVGGVFLLERILPFLNLSQFLWPALIIGVGLFMVLTPNRHLRRRERRERWKNKWKGKWEDQYGDLTSHASNGDRIESVSIFGETKKVIVSKNFKGGEVTLIFGGAEINLSQADIQGKVKLEITQVFGGTRLIIPPHWEIQSTMVTVMGSIEDKRLVSDNHNPDKILVLDGTSVMGGIEILSQ
jgi:predicted membrane protein